MYWGSALMFLIEDLLRALHRRKPRPVDQRPRLRRLSPAERRARYAAKWRRKRPYTGETQRL